MLDEDALSLQYLCLMTFPPCLHALLAPGVGRWTWSVADSLQQLLHTLHLQNPLPLFLTDVSRTHPRPSRYYCNAEDAIGS